MMTVNGSLGIERLFADVAEIQIGEFIVLLELESRNVFDVGC
jgi:hypothetical protein